MDLVTEIYKSTVSFPDHEKFGLTLQIRRSAVSIPSNIAEGAARNTKKEFIQFLHIALGSVAELETQLLISRNVGFTKEIDNLNNRISEVRRMLLGLLKHQKNTTQKSAGKPKGYPH